MFPPLTEVFVTATRFILVSVLLCCVALLAMKGRLGSQLSKTAAKRWSLALLGAGVIAFLAGGAAIATALYLRVDPRSVVELEFTRIDQEHGATAEGARTVNDPNQIRRAFALLSGAQLHDRNHESYLDGYMIRMRLRGEPDFSRRILFAYRKNGSGGDVSIVVASVSRRGQVDAGEYSVPEFHDWLRKTVDPLFLGSPEAKGRQ